MTTAPASDPVIDAPPAGLLPYLQFVGMDVDSIDLIDHVAYSLYKRDKLAFCTAVFEAKKSAPTSEEMGAFNIASVLPDRITGYRNEATELLREFSEQVLSEAELEVEDRYRQQFYAELKKARPFWRSIWDNILANLGALAITALVVLVIYGSRIGFTNLIGDIFNYDIKERTSQSTAGNSQPQISPAK